VLIHNKEREMGMLDWTEKSSDVLQQGGVIAPDERLPWPQTAAMGVQHVIAMFGATVLAPILMGFDPNLAIFMSGIGTLIFYFITGGKVPSYLGSSFAFIGVVIAATAYAGKGPNANIGVALGAIIACGLVYTLIGAVVQAIGTGWIERLMPPVVTGAVVAVIGLNLAGIPIKNMAASNFDSWMQLVTFVCVALVAVFTRGMVQRLLILVGLLLATHHLPVAGQRHGPGQADGFFGHRQCAVAGLPEIHRAGVRQRRHAADRAGGADPGGRESGPHQGRAGHDGPQPRPVHRPRLHRRRHRHHGVGRRRWHGRDHVCREHRRDGRHAHLFHRRVRRGGADGAGAGLFSPKFGAFIQAIPLPVMGGVSIVVFGLITMAGAKIWVDNKVDFTDPANLLTAAITLVLGTGDFTLKFGSFALGGIGTATFGVGKPGVIRFPHNVHIVERVQVAREVAGSLPGF
jgi:putative pyrimidine permease RutG